jgi:hypothetical protein
MMEGEGGDSRWLGRREYFAAILDWMVGEA